MVQSKALRPEWLPAVALSSALAAGDAGLEPAGRRPRRPGLPHRALPARRLGDLERQLVRRPLHPHLQRPLPAAGGAAGAAGGRDARGRRLLLPLRPPRPRPLGGRRALGDALVRRRRGHPARRRPAHLRPRRRLRAGGAALPAARPRDARRSSPPRPAPSPARSPPPSSPASSWSPALAERGRRAQPRRVGAAALALGLVLVPNLAFPEPGQFPFAFSSYVAIPLWCGGALFLTRGLARRGAPAAPGGRRLPAGLDRVLAGPEPAGRQRGAPRRPLRRAGAGRGDALPPAAPPRAALSRCGPGAGDGRRPLLAGDRQRQPDRPQRRRSLDPADLLPARRRAGCAPTVGRRVRVEVPPTANHWESAYLAPSSSSPAAGCASSTRPATTSSTTTKRAHRRRLRRTGCATTRSPTSPCPTRRSTTPRSPSAA